jgi:quercetin dioxygenase-like cupin family protein
MGSDKSRCEKKEAKMKQMLIVLCLITGTAVAQETPVTPLISKELTGIPGKEATMITVQYDRGASDVIHRHNAHVFVYVLEGRVVMQVQGGEQLTLGPGQTFYEGPDDVHLVSRNASSTEPAKFLVFFVKDKGAPILIPVK